VFEGLISRLPIPVLEGDTLEIDHPEDLDRAATWLAERVDETRAQWTP
jgi:hypothetical protein